MKLSSLVHHVAEVLGTVLQTFPAGGATRAVPPDALIASFFRARKYLGSHDRRFIAECVYGTIRHLRRIDNILKGSAVVEGRPAQEALSRALTYLVYVDEGRTPERSRELRDSFADSLPPDPISPNPSSSMTANPPSRSIDLADRYSFPTWMVERFITQYGEPEAEHLCRALNHQAPLAIRTNSHKSDRETLQRLLGTAGIASNKTTYSPLGLALAKRMNVFALEAFREGLFEVQDEGSQLVPLFMDPKPTAKILDACAGAGGKTLELSALMRNRGEIVATDVSRRRLEELRKRARRAGAHNIRVREEDYTENKPPASREGIFDQVLLDAPCSGTGTIRRNPGLKWTVSEESVKELVEKQSQLLSTVAESVRSGGILWYCTCSLLREENEGVVERFLAASPSFAHVDPAAQAERLGLPDALSDSMIRLLPHRHGTDGFFLAPLQRMT